MVKERAARCYSDGGLFNLKRMTENKDKQTQYEAGATLLGQPIKFKIPFWFGTKLTFGIRPLHPGTIVRISQEETKLTDVNESENMIHELMKAGKNLKVFCRIISVAILNNPVTIRLFTLPLSRLLMWRTTTQEVFAYSGLVYRQMGAEHFFFTMTLTRGMNFLKKRTPMENTVEDKPSGEQSD